MVMQMVFLQDPTSAVNRLVEEALLGGKKGWMRVPNTKLVWYCYDGLLGVPIIHWGSRCQLDVIAILGFYKWGKLFKIVVPNSGNVAKLFERFLNAYLTRFNLFHD